MTDKVTMKITEEAHNNLQMVKALAKVKTFSEAINIIAQEFIESRVTTKRK